jgi:hypothetical protein
VETNHRDEREQNGALPRERLELRIGFDGLSHGFALPEIRTPNFFTRL